MSIDTIGNFITSIRNGVLASKLQVSSPYSKIKEQIAQILKDEGFIKNFAVTQQDNHKEISISLKYVDGESVIHEIERISTPGRRRYESIKNVRPVIGGLGISILTTHRGVMTNRAAKEQSVGGEVICTVW